MRGANENPWRPAARNDTHLGGQQRIQLLQHGITRVAQLREVPLLLPQAALRDEHAFAQPLRRLLRWLHGTGAGPAYARYISISITSRYKIR